MPKNNSRPMRELRHTQAEARQSAHSALSTEQKLAKIESRPGKSGRERKRLSV